MSARPRPPGTEPATRLTIGKVLAAAARDSPTSRPRRSASSRRRVSSRRSAPAPATGPTPRPMSIGCATSSSPSGSGYWPLKVIRDALDAMDRGPAARARRRRWPATTTGRRCRPRPASPAERDPLDQRSACAGPELLAATGSTETFSRLRPSASSQAGAVGALRRARRAGIAAAARTPAGARPRAAAPPPLRTGGRPGDRAACEQVAGHADAGRSATTARRRSSPPASACTSPSSRRAGR